MKTFHLGVLLIISMLTDVSFGGKKFGYFFETQFQDPFENRYDGGSNEYQTSEFEHFLERKDLRRKILFQTWEEKTTILKLNPTSLGYKISPNETKIIQCVPGGISIVGFNPNEDNTLCQENVYEKKRTISIKGGPSSGDNEIELITFSVPDGCACRQRNE